MNTELALIFFGTLRRFMVSRSFAGWTCACMEWNTYYLDWNLALHLLSLLFPLISLTHATQDHELHGTKLIVAHSCRAYHVDYCRQSLTV